MIESYQFISKMVNEEIFRVIEKKNEESFPFGFEFKFREDGCWKLFLDGSIPISFTVPVAKKRRKVLVIKAVEDKIILSGAIEKVKQDLRRILEKYYLP